MEENFDALEVIARTRGKVEMDAVPTGEKLFPLWGWLTAVFFLAEFILWQTLHQDWCVWLWAGIPLIGVPLMAIIVRRDHQRAHMRTHGSKIILDYWIFVGAASCCGGFLLGVFDLFEVAAIPLICLLVGIGAFITGEVNRFRPKVWGGLAGAAIGIAAFVFQGELWIWQTLCLVLVSMVSLVIPGHLYIRKVKNGI